jgi:hypothetical protein
MQPPDRSNPISDAVSREDRKPRSTPSRRIGTGRPSTPSSSHRKLPSPPGVVASAVTFTRSEPNRSDPIASAGTKLVPA